MIISPPSSSFTPEAPYKFLAGHPSLDFVNTVDWVSHELLNDRLTDYSALIRWAEAAALLERGESRKLLRLALSSPSEAEAAYVAARRVRWVLEQLFVSLTTNRVNDRVLGQFNELLGESVRALGLSPDASTDDPLAPFRWSWRGASERLELPLWIIVWRAAELLTSDEIRRLRRCGGSACGWLFIDNSRNGLRRWCDMATCGNEAKSRRRTVRPRPA